MTQFFGKYRGKVENNIDPHAAGPRPGQRARRARRRTPELGDAVRPVRRDRGRASSPSRRSGANVWVEFEGGDPDYPIWSGCFWGTGEVPAMPAVAEMKVLKTDGVTLTLERPAGRRAASRSRSGRRGPDTAQARLRRRRDRAHERRGERQAHPGQRLGQQRRAGGDLMPGFLLHVGATVHLPARRAGAADRPAARA